MKVKCSYCGQYYDDNIPQCPNCGSPNDHLHRTSDAVPKTIEELRQYCEENGFTPERTRFFIGEDYKKPRAFGIYKDDEGEFVVYKNKADGSRAVRYRGKDEAYAVNELYERLQSEILNQKAHYVERQKEKAVKTVRKKQNSGIFRAVIYCVIAVVGTNIFLHAVSNKFKNGYYHYNDTYYYSLDDNWYYFDTDHNDWYPASGTPEDLTQNADEFYKSDYYDDSSGTTDFSRTDFYSDWEEAHRSDNDSDSDSDWDSSDWDSSDTDWDSDW